MKDPMQLQRVVVTGGSGFVGRAVCRRLAARWPGLRIVVPTRRADHAAALRPLPNVETPVADVHDPAALARCWTAPTRWCSWWPSCTAAKATSSVCT
jgi:nucleoside-diphosphate-sugar epimerase